MLTIGKYWCRRPDLGIFSTFDEEGGSERTLPSPYSVAAACFYMPLFYFNGYLFLILVRDRVVILNRRNCCSMKNKQPRLG